MNKIFQKLFKNKGLDIAINCTIKIVTKIVTLPLHGSYSPYEKPDEETNYIHSNFKTTLKKNPF